MSNVCLMVVVRFENTFAFILTERLCEAKRVRPLSHLFCILGTMSEHGAKRHAACGGELSSLVLVH